MNILYIWNMHSFVPLSLLAVWFSESTNAEAVDLGHSSPHVSGRLSPSSFASPLMCDF